MAIILASQSPRRRQLLEQMGFTDFLIRPAQGEELADPNLDPNAVKYDTITYDDILAQHLQVMDSTATSLSMDNKIPVVLFALKDPENILRVARGEKIGTIVKD